MLPGGARTISYDIDPLDDEPGIIAEIGPKTGKHDQGPIVGILEYGTPTTAPRGYGHEALRENEEDFERGIAKAVDDTMQSGLRCRVRRRSRRRVGRRRWWMCRRACR
jgi:hypothetical protein